MGFLTLNPDFLPKSPLILTNYQYLINEWNLLEETSHKPKQCVSFNVCLIIMEKLPHASHVSLSSFTLSFFRLSFFLFSHSFFHHLSLHCSLSHLYLSFSISLTCSLMVSSPCHRESLPPPPPALSSSHHRTAGNCNRHHNGVRRDRHHHCGNSAAAALLEATRKANFKGTFREIAEGFATES
ncbi:hypothetical protein RIF29_20578 [Crotalaria pallida]|uniref:Uncharacterized protein n=1 Tax=Crotalaria pallida TaxID=3830 RepID=A0AAN9F1U9_CROPI